MSSLIQSSRGPHSVSKKSIEVNWDCVHKLFICVISLSISLLKLSYWLDHFNSAHDCRPMCYYTALLYHSEKSFFLLKHQSNWGTGIKEKKLCPSAETLFDLGSYAQAIVRKNDIVSNIVYWTLWEYILWFMTNILPYCPALGLFFIS